MCPAWQIEMSSIVTPKAIRGSRDKTDVVRFKKDVLDCVQLVLPNVNKMC